MITGYILIGLGIIVGIIGIRKIIKDKQI